MTSGEAILGGKNWLEPGSEIPTKFGSDWFDG